jgi:hypothetical protein
LIGIEAGPMDMGTGVTPEVRKALPGAAELIEKELQETLQSCKI